MDKLEELYLALMENNGQDYEESGTIFTEDFVKEIAASKSAQLTKDLMIEFAEWIGYNVKVFPDGWHYKGEAYSTHELLEIFLKQRNGNQD